MLELFYSINHLLLWSDIDFIISLDGYNIKNIRWYMNLSHLVCGRKLTKFDINPQEQSWPQKVWLKGKSNLGPQPEFPTIINCQTGWTWTHLDLLRMHVRIWWGIIPRYSVLDDILASLTIHLPVYELWLMLDFTDSFTPPYMLFSLPESF